MASIETRTREIGENLLRGMKGKRPGIFDKAWWSGQVLDWAMRDRSFKTEMFRFVDVFPVLDSPAEVARHAQEYLLRPGVRAPAAIKIALKGAGLGRLAEGVAARQVAKNLEGMARGFIAGRDAAGALDALRRMRLDGRAFTVDLLGEATVSEVEAEIYAERYRALITDLCARTASWEPSALLEEDDRGIVPRVNVSIKVSAMDSQIDPLAFDRSADRIAKRLLPLFDLARRLGAFVNLDLEHYAYKDLTLAIFRRVMEDPRLEGFEQAGLVIQAYLRDAEQDLRDTIRWARKSGRRITVRLVKGAYWDVEVVRARQEGWPCPVWLDKADSDHAFEALADRMLASHKYVRSAFGSHNVRSLAAAMALAERHKVPPEGYEVQCLFGMAEPIQAACVELGLRVRVYTPVGELIPGMAYLVRRLLENTSNEGWLRQGFAEGASHEVLLARPEPLGRPPMLRAAPRGPSRPEADQPFLNEPLRELRRPGPREALRRALADLGARLGETCGPVVAGEELRTGRTLQSVDPSDGHTVVGTVHLAGRPEADRAVEAAERAFPSWRDTPAAERAGVLFRLAAAMRRQRDPLSALLVREVGKPWREADAEVCEAVDFCAYYGREMLRLAAPRSLVDLPGETSHLLYQPRGVAAVIAPWNFPLAILTGMATAALVAGNTVLLKPAEQSSLIAGRLVRLAHEAGAPAGAFQLLPGLGEEVGAHLCAHRRVATIAFTGSRAVGLQIWAQAGLTVPGQDGLKRVICEMGGKNAIIVDSDADLDEAVLGTVASAFGFAGQKCSACSRVIVLDACHDAFVERLVEATRSLEIGAAWDPASAMGPVIDAEARRRIEGVLGAARARIHLALGGSWEGPGHFVRPHIFTGVPPDDPLATEEVFAPVLSVIRAGTFDEALEIAVGVDYALTGGVYSRSPAHIEKARERFRVGNLYINRKITGAIVGRHPFGGFRMSGGGTKAGGPDYLLSFLDPRVITENTQRHGFAPELE